MLYVFCRFTPLFRCFRPSRVSQTIELEEIYRLVSKILNFMLCGSVLSRFRRGHLRYLMGLWHGICKVAGQVAKNLKFPITKSGLYHKLAFRCDFRILGLAGAEKAETVNMCWFFKLVWRVRAAKGFQEKEQTSEKGGSNNFGNTVWI